MPSSRRSRARPASNSMTASCCGSITSPATASRIRRSDGCSSIRASFTREEMSMDKIREYMEANPKEGEELRLRNRSYVFFSATCARADDECLGSQGIPLTPWRSLAVDPSIHVYGTPIWVEAEFPLNRTSRRSTRSTI